MKYYVDGYNYIFRHLDLKKNLQSQREALIYDLNQKAALLHLTIIIVFDAHYQAGDEAITHYKHIKIIYTAEHESADDYILKKLSSVSSPKQYTLVTSDNSLSRKARVEHVHTESIDEFIEWINKRYQSRLQCPKKIKPKKNNTPIIQTLNMRTQVQLEDDMLSHYEKVFLEKFEKSNAGVEPTKKIKVVDTSESEYERWLRIFENKSS